VRFRSTELGQVGGRRERVLQTVKAGDVEFSRIVGLAADPDHHEHANPPLTLELLIVTDLLLRRPRDSRPVSRVKSSPPRALDGKGLTLVLQPELDLEVRVLRGLGVCAGLVLVAPPVFDREVLRVELPDKSALELPPLLLGGQCGLMARL